MPNEIIFHTDCDWGKEFTIFLGDQGKPSFLDDFQIYLEKYIEEHWGYLILREFEYIEQNGPYKEEKILPRKGWFASLFE